MKKLIVILSLCPILAWADIIVQKEGENIEDVTVISVASTEITYELNGSTQTLSKDQVSAILYSDGRYEEIKAAAIVPQENTLASDFESSSESTTTKAAPIVDKKEWTADWRMFCQQYPDEVKTVSRAISIVVRKQGFFNFSGAKDIDMLALDAYVTTKRETSDGIAAVRARNAVYQQRAEELETMDPKEARKSSKSSNSQDAVIGAGTSIQASNTQAKPQGDAFNEFSVLAYGALNDGNYEVNHTWDGAIVEWRVIIKKEQKTITSPYQQLGVVPFALVSPTFYNNYVADYIQFGIDLPEECSLMEQTPFVVKGLEENNQYNVTIEFLVKKDGFEPYTFSLDTFSEKVIQIQLNLLTSIKAPTKKK